MSAGPIAARRLLDAANADPAALYLLPGGWLSGGAAVRAVSAGTALPAGRANRAAAHAELWLRRPEGPAERLPLAAGAVLALLDAAPGGPAYDRLSLLVGALGRQRASWGPVALDRPRVMAVLNVTPDSFSDGGLYATADAAVARGRAQLAAGADLIDVGGESTRPGAEPVPPEEECRRVLPVVAALAEAGAIVSIDTRRPETMAAALDAGAAIVNDVSGLADPAALALVAARGVPAAIMHMQGEPATMQAAPRYRNVLLDVVDHLAHRLDACRAARIPAEHLAIDPGIGFGKTLGHNLALMAGLAMLRTLGAPVLLGVSRKKFVGTLTGVAAPRERLAGSLAAALVGLAGGADIVRVHDVAETVEAVRLVAALDAADAQ